MKKRLLSVLLALCMLLTMLPTTVFAADSSTGETKVSGCNTALPPFAISLPGPEMVMVLSELVA